MNKSVLCGQCIGIVCIFRNSSGGGGHWNSQFQNSLGDCMFPRAILDYSNKMQVFPTMSVCVNKT